MANYKGTDTDLTAVANAIRAKGGISAQLEWPSEYISAIQAIPTPEPPLEIVSWSSGTDAQIAALIQAAHDGDIDLQRDAGWAVGDERTISISAFTTGDNVEISAQDARIMITSFDDYENCGNVLQFDFASGFSTNVGMNNSGSNNYETSAMRVTTLPALVNALPQWLSALLIPLSIKVAGSNSSTIRTLSGDKLALRSQVELFDTATSSYAGEGEYVSYFDTNQKRRRTKGISGSYGSYWLRSPLKSNGAQYLYCLSGGNGISSDTAWKSYILAPFGCL